MSGFLGAIGGAASQVTRGINAVGNAVGAVTGAFGGGASPFGFNAPPSQKGDERPIAFALEDDGQIVEEVTLGLRPSEFRRTDPTRTTVHHTLGGAWIDSFGPGLPRISISGTTGWRGGKDGTGEARLKKLRDQVWNAWHNRRKKALQEGRDPAVIKLIYADALNGFTVEVCPIGEMELSRSRSQPLLSRYAMNFVVVDQNRDQLKYLQGGEKKPTPGEQGGFFASVMGSLNRIRDAINRVANWVQKNLVAPIRAFLGLASKVFGAVMGIVGAVRNLVRSVLAIPMAFAQAGTQLFRTIAAVASLPAQIKGDVMGVASAFTNVWCFLLRSRAARLAYADYNPFYGASNCSSISGGRPVSPLTGSNPFWFTPETPSIPGLSVGPAGKAGLLALANSDPVLRPLDAPSMKSHLDAVNANVVVSTDFEPKAVAA